MIVVETFIRRDSAETVAQFSNGCTESSCSMRLPSNSRRCSHFWAL